jgi:hypothetical protein
MIKKFFKFLSKIRNYNKTDKKILEDQFFLKLEMALVSLLILEPKFLFALYSTIFKLQKNRIIHISLFHYDLFNNNYNTQEKKIFLKSFFFLIKNLNKTYFLPILQKINYLEKIDAEIDFQFNEISSQDIKLIQNYTYLINLHISRMNLKFSKNNSDQFVDSNFQKLIEQNYSYFLRRYSLASLKDLLN